MSATRRRPPPRRRPDRPADRPEERERPQREQAPPPGDDRIGEMRQNDRTDEADDARIWDDRAG